MRIEIGTLINNEIKIIRSLSTYEFDEYKKHWHNLQEMKHDSELFQVLLLNHNSYLNNMSTYLNKLEKDQIMNYSEMNLFRLEVNRHFLNFLTSFRTLIDHSETTIKRRYGGKKSAEFQRFRETNNFLSENSFDYRFLYSLRNYAQHCGLPISIVKINTKKREDSIGYNWDVQIEFDLNYLKSNYNDWSAKLKQDFSDLGDTLDVLTVSTKFLESIREISSTLKEIKRELFEDAEVFMRSLTNTDKTNFTSEYKIFQDMVREDNKLKIKIQTIPLNLFQELKN